MTTNLVVPRFSVNGWAATIYESGADLRFSMLPARRKQEKMTNTRLILAQIYDSYFHFVQPHAPFSSSKPGESEDEMAVSGGSSSKIAKKEDEMGQMSSSSSKNGIIEDEMSKSRHSSSNSAENEDEIYGGMKRCA